MSAAEERIELVKMIGWARGKARDENMVNLCDRMLRYIQRDSMTDRGVPIEEQEKVLQPVVAFKGDL